MTTLQDNGGRTGWPPGLLQDDCRGLLANWLSSRPDALYQLRKLYAETMPAPKTITLQERLRAGVQHYKDVNGAESAMSEAADKIDALESAIEEQTRTIGALNQCLGGKDSTSLENITRIGELEAQVAYAKEVIEQRNAMLSRGHADFMQAITDPENQPSQFGTVTLAMYQGLEAQVSALTKALNGFIANSCRVDWPADIYDAAIAAQRGTV